MLPHSLCACSALHWVYLIAIAASALCGLTHAKGAHKVHCTEDLMRVEIGIEPELYSANTNSNTNTNSDADASASATTTTTATDTATPPTQQQIYLEGLKGYPDERCQPELNGSLAIFRLSLSDFYECGVTRMVNQLTGKKVYYHKIVIETGSNGGKELVGVKCVISSGPVYNVLTNATTTTSTRTSTSTTTTTTTTGGSSQPPQPQLHRVALQRPTPSDFHRSGGLVKRDVLPAGFQEPEDLEITTSLTERAPEPRLAIGVSQNGKKVTGDLTVRPGTPLIMEINLDRDSAPVYGLGVNYLEVTDTRQLSETIIFKGCTVDPYLFENFNTIDGDTLNAKFKAFKFPDSSYVQFRATVNVCLDKCLGTQCSNGQVGYGRRRRRDTSDALTPTTLMDTNKVYEISLAMFIKIDDLEGVNRNEVLQLEEKLRELKLANQRLARNSRGNFGEPMKLAETSAAMSVPAFVVDERELNAAQSKAHTMQASLLVMLTTLLWLCRL